MILFCRLTLLIKLFVIMGIPWLFEVLTSIIRFNKDPILATIETIWDILNSLQGISILHNYLFVINFFLFSGVYIFAVFVCKKKVFEILLKKTGLRKRKLSLNSGVTTQSSVLVSRNCSGKR